MKETLGSRKTPPVSHLKAETVTGIEHDSQNKVTRVSGGAISMVFLGGTWLAILYRLGEWPGKAWIEGLWLLCCLGVTVLWSRRSLPLQNILLAVATLSTLGWLAQNVYETAFNSVAESPGIRLLTWGKFAGYSQPLAWAVLLLNARGAAKLLCGSKEKKPNRGLWTLAVAGLLVCVTGLCMKSAQSNVGLRNWPWEIISLAFWWAFTVLCLALATPALLKKRPGPDVDPVEPVWIWVAIHGFAIAAATPDKKWITAMFLATLIAVATWAVLRGHGSRGREIAKQNRSLR